MRPAQSNILLTTKSATALFQKTACDSYIARGDRALLHALAENKIYQNPTELWIANSAPAQALLRHSGVQDTFVAGDGSDFEKFLAFCTVMGDTVANPLKLQCHVALREMFDCPLLLNETNAAQIWQTVCERLAREDITPRGFLKKCGVDTVLILLSPWESLEDFARISDLGVLPVFSPDSYLAPAGKPFAATVRALDSGINDFKGFCKALIGALDRFAARGCRVAVQSVLPEEFFRPNEYHAALYFEKAMAGETLAPRELALYQAQLWRVLCEAYASRDMTLELCIGETPAKREISHPVCMDFSVKATRELLDYLKERVGLPRLALYTEEAALIPTVAALAARYPAMEEGVPQISLGVWQAGPAETSAQLRALAGVAPLSACVGALPDARLPLFALTPSLFHRTLCTELADWEAHGETCAGEENLCRIITRLTGENMRSYYNL